MGPLIAVDELAGLLGDEDLVLADVRWNLGGPPGEPEFLADHLLGARFVDLDADLADPPGAGGRHPLPDPERFAAAMRAIGVGADSLVVAYDSATSLSAARLWWLLRDAGHERVRVLDGGLAAWLAVGLPTESGPAVPAPAGGFAARPGQLAHVDSAELLGLLGTGRTILDVRTAVRYRGEDEPIDPVAGHIPGAINLDAMTAVDGAGRFRSRSQLAEHFAGVGVEPVVYCGSGVTASHTLLALAASGRDDGVLYPGSWSGWIADPERPIARGAG